MSGGGKFGFTGYASNGISPSPLGPTNVSLATGSSGVYDNACYVYRSGSSSTLAETGASFSGGNATISIAESAFSGARDRIIAFGAFARGTTSGGALSYAYTLTELIAFPGGSLNSDPYNNIQDTLVVVPGAGISVNGGVGPYVLFTTAPNIGDSGVFRMSVAVTDSNGTTTSSLLNMTINFT